MVELKFDGKRYGYWQSVEIHASVDDLCASVQLAVMSLEQGPSVLPLTENTVVEVLVDGALAATMRVDQVSRRVSATNHEILIEGRSLGRELVDCQFSKTYKNLKLGEIIMQLAGLFKVPLQLQADTALVPDFSMQCEAPANALINAARAANLLLYPAIDGGLILAEPSNKAPVATLVYGRHILRYSITDEYKLRFGEYVVKGYDHDSMVSTKGVVTDAKFDFFRPLHILADKSGGSIDGCDNRAQLERNRRTARAHRINVDVQGWTHPGGVWAINTQVRIVIKPEHIDGVFLISERTLKLDGQGGSITTLQLVSREAFTGNKTKSGKTSVAGKQ